MAALVFALPYDDFPFPFSFGGSLVTPLAAAVVLAAYFLTPYGRLRGLHRPTGMIPIYQIYLVYAIVVTIAMALAVPFVAKESTALAKAAKGVVSILLAYSVLEITYSYAVRDEGRTQALVRYGFFASLAPLALGMLAAVATILSGDQLESLAESLTSLVSKSTKDVTTRTRLATREPSWAAQQLIVLTIPMILMYRTAVRRWWATAVLWVAIACLLFTRSGLMVVWAGGILLYHAVRAVMLVTTRLSLNVVSMALTVALVALLISVALRPELLSYQMAKLGSLLTGGLGAEASTGARVGSWLAGLNAFWSSPVSGVGLSQFGFYFADSAPKWLLETEQGAAWANPGTAYFASTKNYVIKILAETGIVGLALVASPLVLAFARLRRIRTPASRHHLLMLYGVGLASLNVDSLAFLYIPFMIGLMFAYIKRAGTVVAAGGTDLGVQA